MPEWHVPEDSFERTVESEHYYRCTHQVDKCLLIKDAEQVAIFWDPKRDLMHISVHLQNESGGGGFICKQVSANVYERMTGAEEIALLREQMAKLKPLL